MLSTIDRLSLVLIHGNLLSVLMLTDHPYYWETKYDELQCNLSWCLHISLPFDVATHRTADQSIDFASLKSNARYKFTT